MLVDNKFLYLSLPRCASTSFVITAYRNNIKLEYHGDYVEKHNSTIDKFLPNEELADNLKHPHESITLLDERFGYGKFDVISVHRNRHERFISLWKHILDEVYRTGDKHSFDVLCNLDYKEVLWFESNDISDRVDSLRNLTTKKFIEKYKLTKTNPYLEIILGIAITPYSHYHNFDNRIIWFDFENLNKLEEWVSNKLERPFKLEKINSSQHFDCNLKLNDSFIKRYNSIFDRFDLPKTNKTFL